MLKLISVLAAAALLIYLLWLAVTRVIIPVVTPLLHRLGRLMFDHPKATLILAGSVLAMYTVVPSAYRAVTKNPFTSAMVVLFALLLLVVLFMEIDRRRNPGRYNKPVPERTELDNDQLQLKKELEELNSKIERFDWDSKFAENRYDRQYAARELSLLKFQRTQLKQRIL